MPLTFALLSGPTSVSDVARQTVYTVPVAVKAVLTKLTVTKPSAGAAVISLYYNVSGTDRFMGTRSLPAQNSEAVFSMQGETLPTGSIIKVESTTALEYIYTLFGGTE